MSAQAPRTFSLTRFSAPAVVLHWTIAALVLLNLYLGLRFDTLPTVAQKSAMIQLHKSVGITILVLSVLRLAWRLMNPPPPYPDTMRPWEKLVASVTHWSFYGLLIGLPLVGWTIVSASLRNSPIILYKTLHWPRLPVLPHLPDAARKAIEEAAIETHETLAWIAMALIVLHVGAALKHQFLTRDGVLYRMAPMPLFRPRG